MTIRLPINPQDRDLARLAMMRRYLGAFDHDPPAQGNEQNIWVRMDLEPPELRTYRNGVVEVLGSGGGAGPPGPPGPPGAPMVWRGAWDAGTDYAANDVVSHEGGAWIAATDRAVGEEPGVAAAWEIMLAAGAGGLLNLQVLSGSGTYTPTAGTAYIVLEMVGGGGGGAGADSGAGATRSGGAGGGGAYLLKRITDNFSGAAYAVGAGGAGGAAGNNNGTNGGDSTFTLPASTVFTAGGGLGGGAGADGSGASPSTTGASGGVATNGDINVPGEAGHRGLRFTANNAMAGPGGSSFMGFIRTSSNATFGATSAAGDPGEGYGCGGGGGICTDTAAAVGGGDGAAGLILVWEYASPNVPGVLGNYTIGTAFPLTPDAGDRCLRTDLGREYWYSGSVWIPLSPVSARITTTSPGTATAAESDVDFDTLVYDDATDTGLEFWNAGSPNQFKVPVGWGGLYHITASAGVTGNTTASRYYLKVRRNGATTIAYNYENRQGTTGVETSAGVSFEYRLADEDTIDVIDSNLSGNLARQAAFCVFTITRLGG